MAWGNKGEFAYRKSSILHGSACVNNLLEFIGMAVNIWLECMAADDQDCILALGR
jgi:hypothetical protein